MAKGGLLVTAAVLHILEDQSVFVLLGLYTFGVPTELKVDTVAHFILAKMWIIDRTSGRFISGWKSKMGECVVVVSIVSIIIPYLLVHVRLV